MNVLYAGFAYLLGLIGISLFALAILTYTCVPPKTDDLYTSNHNNISSCTGSLSPKRDIR